MKIYDFTFCNNFFLIGDIHGDFEYLMNNIRMKLNMVNILKKKTIHSIKMPMMFLNENGEVVVDHSQELDISDKTEETGNDEKIIEKENKYKNILCIVLGDVGFGFAKDKYYNEIFTKFNTLLAESNSYLLMFRGNHDDPTYFSEEKIKFSNISTIPDYSIIKMKEHNALCVGGGISIDRTWRLSKESTVNKYIQDEKDFKKLYWENESVVFDENEMKQVLESGIKIDMLFTHTPPINDESLGNKDILESWLECDEKLQDDLDKEKEQMNLLFSFMKEHYKLILCAWAHMHKSALWKKDDIVYSQLTISEFSDVKELLEQQIDEPQTELTYNKPKFKTIYKKRRSNTTYRNDIF